MARFIVRLASVLVLLSFAVSAHAVTVSFDSNAAGAADATMIAGVPNTQFGVSYTALEVGSGTSRSAVKFDVSSLAGQYASIDGITLRLTTSYNQANMLIQIHELLSDWVESQVTWNDRMTGTPWTTAGGDFSATVLGTIDSSTLSPGAAFDSVQEQVTVNLLPGGANAAARKALIDSWTSGSNFGLLLESSQAGLVGFRDRSRVLESDRPFLTIDFTAPPAPAPEPSSLILLGGALAGLSLRRRRLVKSFT